MPSKTKHTFCHRCPKPNSSGHCFHWEIWIRLKCELWLRNLICLQKRVRIVRVSVFSVSLNFQISSSIMLASKKVSSLRWKQEKYGECIKAFGFILLVNDKVSALLVDHGML